MGIFRVRALILEPLKVNNRLLFILLYYTNSTSLTIFYKDTSKTWLSVLFLGVITFHLSCYSEIKGKKDDYWGEYD